jgi:hypothetical protein
MEALLVVNQHIQDVGEVIYLWESGKRFKTPIWRTEDQIVTTGLLTDNALFLGLKSGCILEIGSEGKIDNAYGPRMTTDLNVETERIKISPTPIIQIVEFGGVIYDGSFGGLFETRTGKVIDDRKVLSTRVIGDQLCIVPEGANDLSIDDIIGRTPDFDIDALVEGRVIEAPTNVDIKLNVTDLGLVASATMYAMDVHADRIRREKAKAGYLIDAITKKEIVKLTFCECKPCRKDLDYVVHDGKAYVKNRQAQWREKIHVQDIDTGTLVHKDMYIESEGLFVLGGRVYDLRNESYGPYRAFSLGRFPKIRKRNGVGLVDIENPREKIYAVPDKARVTSISETRKRRMFVLFDQERYKTRLVGHKWPKREQVLEGWAKVL